MYINTSFEFKGIFKVKTAYKSGFSESKKQTNLKKKMSENDQAWNWMNEQAADVQIELEQPTEILQKYHYSSV